MDNTSDAIPIAIFGLIAAWIVYGIITKGWTGSLFGARIKRTFETIEANSNAIAATRLRVHVLDTTNEERIGLELRFTSWLAFSMTPVKMSRSTARQLIDQLSEAVDES